MKKKFIYISGFLYLLVGCTDYRSKMEAPTPKKDKLRSKDPVKPKEEKKISSANIFRDKKVAKKKRISPKKKIRMTNFGKDPVSKLKAVSSLVTNAFKGPSFGLTDQLETSCSDTNVTALELLVESPTSFFSCDGSDPTWQGDFKSILRQNCSHIVVTDDEIKDFEGFTKNFCIINADKNRDESFKKAISIYKESQIPGNSRDLIGKYFSHNNMHLWIVDHNNLNSYENDQIKYRNDTFFFDVSDANDIRLHADIMEVFYKKDGTNIDNRRIRVAMQLKIYANIEDANSVIAALESPTLNVEVIKTESIFCQSTTGHVDCRLFIDDANGLYSKVYQEGDSSDLSCFALKPSSQDSDKKELGVFKRMEKKGWWHVST